MGSPLAEILCPNKLHVESDSVLQYICSSVGLPGFCVPTDNLHASCEMPLGLLIAQYLSGDTAVHLPLSDCTSSAKDMGVTHLLYIED